MSDYIPDPIERGESSAEAWHSEHSLPDGKMKCYNCDEVFTEGTGGTLVNDPYAPEACPKCYAERISEWEASKHQSEVSNPDYFQDQ